MVQSLRCLAFFTLLLGLTAGAGQAVADADQSLAAQAATNYLRAAAVPMQAGQLDRAATILEEGVKRSRVTPEMLTLLAEVYRQQGRLTDATNAAEEALGLDEQYAPAHVQMGDIYMDLGWLESAAESYRAALVVDPYAAAARYRLVHCLAESGKLRVAERECREFLAEDENATMCLALAGTLERQERFQDALVAYDRAIALDDRCSDAHAGRADLLCRTGDYDEAMTASQAALAIDGDCARAHAALGLASAHREDFMGAYSHAVKAEQAGVDMSEVWSMLQRQH